MTNATVASESTVIRRINFCVGLVVLTGAYVATLYIVRYLVL